MKDLLSQIIEWRAQEKPFALARVIKTWGSAPRPTGSAMLISDKMEMVGSVSGGCVEGAVLKEAKAVLENKTGKKLHYGVSDDEAWSVGLSCGGKIQVYLQYFGKEGKATKDTCWQKLIDKLQANKSCILVTLLKDGENQNTLLTPDGDSVGASIPEEVKAAALSAFEKRTHDSVFVDDQTYFINIFPRKSQILIIGSAHITTALVQLANMYDFEPIVIDPRAVFAKNTQFKDQPNQIIEKYPSEVLGDFKLDAYTYAVILSHDPKIDDNALQILLPSEVAYIGALGSRKTHAKRVARLQEAGFTEEQIARIEAPIGLNIGAVGAKEIALGIMGSIIKAKNSRE